MQRIGKVVWYSEKRGFGILSAPAADGAAEQFYVHVSKIVKSPAVILQGQQAAFTVGLPPRREGDLPMAVNVTISDAPQATGGVQ